MQRSLEYEDNIKTIVGDIGKTSSPVVIFGASRGGWHIMKALKNYGIDINAFIDNDRQKHGAYFDIPVLSPEGGISRFPEARAFLGLFTESASSAVKEQLTGLGFRNPINCLAESVFIYLTKVAERKCDREKLAGSINVLMENYSEGPNHHGYTASGHFVSPFVSGVITQKCSLRCRDCAQLIPYYKSPLNFPPEAIVNDIRNYAKAFDIVPEMSLHGGEPFLHPQLEEICEGVADIPNIVFINLITNGTIMPSAERMQKLGKIGVDIHQSDYGKLSKRQGEFSKICDENNIYCDIHFVNPNQMWVKAPPIKKHGRTKEANAAIYKKCVSSKICCQIMDGELHRCSLSMHASHQGAIPRFKEDFIRLDNNTPENERNAEIRKYLTQDASLMACDYCDPFNGTEEPPAIQLGQNEK